MWWSDDITDDARPIRLLTQTTKTRIYQVLVQSVIIICKWNLDSPICRLKSPPGSFSSILQSENLAWTETPLCSSGGSTIVGGCLRDLVTSGFVIACCCVYCLQCTAQYDLVCVGHCLGAGVAAILAVLLRREYPDLHCFAYSPPGCLMRYQSISQSVL